LGEILLNNNSQLQLHTTLGKLFAYSVKWVLSHENDKDEKKYNFLTDVVEQIHKNFDHTFDQDEKKYNDYFNLPLQGSETVEYNNSFLKRIYTSISLEKIEFQNTYVFTGF